MPRLWLIYSVHARAFPQIPPLKRRQENTAISEKLNLYWNSENGKFGGKLFLLHGIKVWSVSSVDRYARSDFLPRERLTER